MMRGKVTAAVWAISLLGLLAAGLIATEFVFMATTMDPVDAIGAGARPWIDAALVVGAFAALVVTVIVKLLFLHSRRFRAVGFGLTAIEVVAVGWACFRVYQDYF